MHRFSLVELRRLRSTRRQWSPAPSPSPRPPGRAGLATLDANRGEVWAKLDAGTEANGLEGAAFVQGVDIGDSPAGEGSIQQGIGLSDELFAPGVLLATGDTLDAGLIDFTSNPDAFDLLTIEISQVAPVPLPASLPLLLAGLGGVAVLRRRRG